MNREAENLMAMREKSKGQVNAVAAFHGLEYKIERTIYVLPGDFIPEAVYCVRQAWGNKVNWRPHPDWTRLDDGHHQGTSGHHLCPIQRRD